MSDVGKLAPWDCRRSCYNYIIYTAHEIFVCFVTYVGNKLIHGLNVHIPGGLVTFKFVLLLKKYVNVK